MRPGEPILLICHSFPPNFGIGGRRWAKFAKELARRGYPVHVIRSTPSQKDKPSLWTTDVQHPNIRCHALPNRYPSVLTRSPVTALKDKVSYSFWTRMLRLCTRGNWFDRGIFWRKPLLHLSEQLIREHGIRNVIATGAPFSLLAYTTVLKDGFPELHVVSDLRDSWTWGIGYGFQSLSQSRLRHEKDRERTVALRSDRLISPHSSVLAHLANEYGVPQEKCFTITHAIDPEDLDVPERKAMGKDFRIVYAGSLYASPDTDRFLDLLLKVFTELRSRHPEAFARCQLDYYITGHDTREYAARVLQAGMSGQVRFHAPVAPKELSAIIAQADLMLIYMPPDKKDVLPTKFHEVFYLKCPILHVGEPGLVSQYVLDKRMGATLLLEELEAELPRILTGERKIEIDPKADHSAYLLAHVTDKLINEVLV